MLQYCTAWAMRAISLDCLCALSPGCLCAHKVLSSLRQIFELADADLSGFLDTGELTECLYKYYRAEGMSRSWCKVQQDL